MNIKKYNVQKNFILLLLYLSLVFKSGDLSKWIMFREEKTMPYKGITRMTVCLKLIQGYMSIIFP